MADNSNIPIEEDGQTILKKYKVDLQRLSDEQRKSLLTDPSQFIKEGFEKHGIRVKNITDSGEPVNHLTDAKKQTTLILSSKHSTKPGMWHFFFVDEE
jgi:hypothetical protein